MVVTYDKESVFVAGRHSVHCTTMFMPFLLKKERAKKFHRVSIDSIPCNSICLLDMLFAHVPAGGSLE